MMSEQPRQEEHTIQTAVAPATAQPNLAPPARGSSGGLRRLLLINVGILLVVLVVAVGAFWLWHQSYYFYSTDDALVSGAIASSSAPAPGTIITVNRSLGSSVRAGETIATLRSGTGATLSANSPINGTIISEGATQGEVLAAGQPIAQVADLGALYITAYVEETHIGDISLGQGVDVVVDAIKDTTFHGRVSRILPATASTFSLLPSTDYSSGNFTKVTQRVPVQITLDGYQGHALYPGESAEVTVHIHS